MVWEAGLVERDMTEQSKVTKWENVSRNQCAALGIGELAGKMSCMNHPQQRTGKSWGTS